LHASDYIDGPLTIKVQAIPNAGSTRTLPPLNLYNNTGHALTHSIAYVSNSGSDATGDGTQSNPYATISKAGTSVPNPEGAIIYLEPGSYDWGHHSYPWIPNTQTLVTIESAPGVDPSQVIINQGEDGGITALAHVKNLTIYPNVLYSGFATQDTNVLWIDHCIMHGTFATNQVWDPWTINFQTYITDSTESGSDLGLQAFFLRNDHITQSYSQGITGSVTVLNVDVHNVNMAQFKYVHPDIDHFYGMQPLMKSTGLIRYNLNATDNIDARGVAVADLNIVYDKTHMTEIPGGWGYILSMGGLIDPSGTSKLMQNVLFIDSSFNGPETWNESPTRLQINAKDVLFQNTTANGASSLAPDATYGPFSGVIVR
jgi:hypothetical protein